MRRIGIVFVCIVVFVLSGFVLAFADNGIDTGMHFSEDIVTISLEQAMDKMLQDSPGAEVAAINFKIAQGTALNYSEAVANINETLDAFDKYGVISSSVSTSDKALVKLRRDFARTQGSSNLEAEMNKLKIDTIRNYFTVLHAADAVKINMENLTIQQKINNNTKMKYELGMVSKQEVLQAEIAVLNAMDALTVSQNNLSRAKMNLNLFLGYDIMQSLELSGHLKVEEVQIVPLEEAIERAITNRNEIKSARYALDIQNALMKKIKVRYSTSSSTYLKQQAALLEAESTFSQSVAGIELDIRGKYLNIMQMKAAIDEGIASVAKAKELVRISEISYNVGINTIVDVQQAHILAISEQLALSQAILDYNLAIEDYSMSMTAGTFASPL